jgi:uncharacterized membrane protein
MPALEAAMLCALRFLPDCSSASVALALALIVLLIYRYRAQIIDALKRTEPIKEE